MRHTVYFAFVFAVGCGPTVSGPDSGADGGDTESSCRADRECDDGRFCNGAERCEPDAASANVFGCVSALAGPCEATCVESLDGCFAACDGTLDHDGDGHRSIACGGDDCDDADADAYPGNLERCDAVHRDEDCDPSTFGARDVDADREVSSACCNRDARGILACGRDCDDQRAATRPGADERCDGRDDNCNGIVDEGVTLRLFVDADGDLRGDHTREVRACLGDVGVASTSTDCDDDDPTTYAAAVEVCDGRDNDCDAVVDEHATEVAFYEDADADGFGRLGGDVVVSCSPVAHRSLVPGDCDDADESRSPRAAERCNGLDDDCNGIADHRIAPGDFEDDDGDGYADARCGGALPDCDDRDPYVHPDAPELFDGRDGDCDGAVDEDASVVLWYVDRDADGYGDSRDRFPISSSTWVNGSVPRAGDCNDLDAAVRPRSIDACNGVDDDCDDEIDEDGTRRAYFRDGDGDGHGDASVWPRLACAAPSGFVEHADDCDDATPTTHPGAVELCDLVDQDCDGRTDDVEANVYHPDGDGDGRGDGARAGVSACLAPLGFGPAGDCDDTDAARYPGAHERCNGRDDDCDADVDEGTMPDVDCSVGHAMAQCENGLCVLTACEADYADCDALASTGCEVVLANDTTNCGRCGRDCGPAGACFDGTCAPFVELDQGYGYSCGLRANGRVTCWGDNRDGQLGAPTSGSGTLGPVEVVGVTDAVHIAAGTRHACALLRTRRIDCWGSDGVGQLGDGAGVSTGVVRVRGIENAIDIAVGDYHACALLATGTVRCWGSPARGALGNGSGMIGAPEPTAVPGLGGVERVFAGSAQSFALTADGLFGWGSNDGSIGVLGVGPDAPPAVHEPTRLASSAALRNGFVTMSCGTYACCVVHADGLSCFGSGVFPLLPIDGVSGAQLVHPGPVQAIAMGERHACVLVGGVLACAGQNANGQLGTGRVPDFSAAFSPVGGSLGFTAVGPGGDANHTCALTDTGRVACFGHGPGVGQWADQFVPLVLSAFP